MTVERATVDGKDTAPESDLSFEAILGALKARIEKYRVDPKTTRLTIHAVEVDPSTQSLVRSARRLNPDGGKDWWKRWLIRAGMTAREAELAARGRTYTRATVLAELEALYRDALRGRTWPDREIVLTHALRARARRTFGSPKAAREAALNRLGLKKPKPHRELCEASAAETILVRSLSERLMRLLPLDRGAGTGQHVSLAAVAGELGLRKWRKPGYLAHSVEKLLFRALDPDPEVLSRFIRTAIKRVVRYRQLREGWSRNRWDPTSIKQPIWREEVEEIIQILRGVRIQVGDLAAETFLRTLPRRASAWGGDFYSYSILDAGAEGPRVKGAGGSGRRAPTPCATPVAAPPAPNNPGRTMSGI